MPKICYVPKKFQALHLGVIEQANVILQDYATQGYDLTLRQLYYQFVARGIMPEPWHDKVRGPNCERAYKNLGSLINDARLAGLIDWKYITDRTRNLRQNAHWGSPEEIVRACAEQYRIDLWETQSSYVEVWVEKDALVGVLEVVCKPLDVAFFSCRGYTSQSEMWVAGQRIVGKLRAGKKVTVLHFGDHDPSGIDMTRDIAGRVRMFVSFHTDNAEDFSLERIALNMDQVQQYNPPPNPAKMSDSRAAGYVDLYGDESWELDALEPAVIAELITSRVGELKDQDLWEEALGKQDGHRAELVRVSDRWEELQKFLEYEGQE